MIVLKECFILQRLSCHSAELCSNSQTGSTVLWKNTSINKTKTKSSTKQGVRNRELDFSIPLAHAFKQILKTLHIDKFGDCEENHSCLKMSSNAHFASFAFTFTIILVTWPGSLNVLIPGNLWKEIPSNKQDIICIRKSASEEQQLTTYFGSAENDSLSPLNLLNLKFHFHKKNTKKRLNKSRNKCYSSPNGQQTRKVYTATIRPLLPHSAL